MSGGANAVLKEPRVADTRTLTPAADQTAKQVPVVVKKAVVFFIGGAADKESYYSQGPNNNVLDAKRALDLQLNPYGESYFSAHLDYKQAKGDAEIEEHFLRAVPSKAMPIYIVGHSLGAWNGAHLSRILTEKGYRVAMLVTLDPVGEGVLVWLFSNIYRDAPEPKAAFWINVAAHPKLPNASDTVAEFGERWYVMKGPDISAFVDINHADAGLMFVSPLYGGRSALEYVQDSIMEYLK
ncbi:pimeloyl-ACP methyl ester carboxylesterase [Pseudomonas nitritireducens]|uniref:Pimeloyl-ACP methyl ester carboxylesterase n=1 Tax=Pseudomonas nitroreducens TaxID=46680 RepID=A0A7W7P332_PSENT|nr:alpha/beta hydrolase [Pseudomonas nitritireducens]MBB4866543.1 pimeloyl-ACP methyl ester carboxylesterase [Pseudomonas nitritireducens]